MERDLSGSYTEYFFDKDGNPLGENNRTTWVDTWVDFDGQHIAHYENNETYFIHSNQVGTANMVTDYSGALVQDELHYPWGQAFTTIGTQTEERFASLHHRDSATNLDPTHFRMYSSDEGCWLTPDPAQADIYNPRVAATLFCMSPTDTRKVCRRMDARGITTTYSYDAENRLTSKTYCDSTPAACPSIHEPRT